MGLTTRLSVPRMSGVCLLAITVFAALLRIHKLDHLSFWLDEGISAWMVSVAPVSRWMHDVHPPLYYALLSIWRTWSDSDWWLRFLSVVFGTATIPVVYSLGKRMFNRAVGCWSAAFLSVLYTHVTYSQEARMYSLMVLLFACALWGLVVGAREQWAVGWIAYTVSASLLAYSHALGPLYVLIMIMLFPALTPNLRRGKTFRPWLLANSAVALLFSPYLLIYAQRARSVARNYWIRLESPEPPIFTTLFHSTVSPIPPVAEIAAHHLNVHLSPLFGRWIWFAPVLVVLILSIGRAPAESRRAIGTLLLAYSLPIVLLSAISLILRPLLIPRVLLPTAVPMVLMLGSFAAPMSIRPPWRQIGLATVFVVFLLGSLYGSRYAAKEQWREASLYLQEHVQPTDIVLLNVGFGRFLLHRYDPQGILRLVPMLAIDEVLARCDRDDAPVCLGKVLGAYPEGQTVWLVEGHRLEGPRNQAEIWLAAHLAGDEPVQMFAVSVERTKLTY